MSNRIEHQAMKKTIETVILAALFVASLLAGVMIQEWTGLRIGFIFIAPAAAALMGLIALWLPETFDQFYVNPEED